jgi:hypothetical protein
MIQSLSLARAARNQKRAALLALFLTIAALWISIPMGEWKIGVFVGVGFLLGLINHLLTEYTLLRSVESGDPVTRKQYAMSSLVRLMGISLVAFVLAAAFWPDGATVLLGLALFHMITLVFTGIPLLKEIKKT